MSGNLPFYSSLPQASIISTRRHQKWHWNRKQSIRIWRIIPQSTILKRLTFYIGGSPTTPSMGAGSIPLTCQIKRFPDRQNSRHAIFDTLLTRVILSTAANTKNRTFFTKRVYQFVPNHRKKFISSEISSVSWSS